MARIRCNMLVYDHADRVCVVKDTCEGCNCDPTMCALYDMFEELGLLKNWEENTALPTYRERLNGLVEAVLKS